MEEKENTQEGVKLSAEEIESAIATVEHLKLMFEKDCSLDWQIETGAWAPEGIEDAVRHYKGLIVKELGQITSILASFLQNL